MKLLITAGATIEAIDAVRYISNVSSGLTGAELAQSFARQGHDVLCLLSQSAQVMNIGPEVEVIRFSSAADLATKIQDLLSTQDFDGVIHTAAVSDYTPYALKINGKEIQMSLQSKLGSEAAEMQITLRRNPKIIDYFIQWSRNKNLLIVGFKLTTTSKAAEVKQAVQRLLQSSGANFVVQNRLDEIQVGEHPFQIWSRIGVISQGKNKSELFSQIAGLFQKVRRQEGQA